VRRDGDYIHGACEQVQCSVTQRDDIDDSPDEPI